MASLWLALWVMTAGGSVSTLADDFADAIRDRAQQEGQPVPTVVFGTARGVDPVRAEQILLSRLRQSLRAEPGGARAVVSVSEEQGTLWLVAVLQSPSMVSASTVVISRSLDRELSEALGVRARKGTGRFVLRRAGVLPRGVLDILVANGDADGELLVLYADELRRYRLADTEAAALVASSPPLPSRRWPRVVAGTLAAGPRASSEVWLATTAGHAVIVDLAARTWRDGRRGLAPLKQARFVADDIDRGPLMVRHLEGSPALLAPMFSPAGSEVIIAGMPVRFRDAVRYGDSWYVVDEDGSLLRVEGGTVTRCATDPVGDRIAAVDFDGNGIPELVATQPSAPNEADGLAVRRTPAEGGTVLLRSALSGGSVVGMSVAVDGVGRPVVMLAEELPDRVLLWRLEAAGS
jgi:hypothetical protein